ncbi:ABC transporter ATP-binding protein [Nocardioides acrostichi]|uniref:ABC transporter ATP-binding protein n=1 Tax=Nocardioides acrostichi TaxID=2784339 RepID=A0A930Y5S8_9ACTN|nr:ABC transporter ATP-binding protein [Nocardioides acrostichi]MBF4161570.1 ABC transporter ATP-binding protein [Nocardioides acrostichi]
MAEPVLEVSGLSKSFGGISVLSDVGFSVARGERRGIIGPNGAGKTTLFNVLSGYLPADAGTVRLCGSDVTTLPAHRRARMGLGRTFQIVALCDELTVEENVLLGLVASNRGEWRLLGSLRGRRGLVERSRELLSEAGLIDLREHKVKAIAYGHRRVLEIVMALTSRARVLLLDEPAAGLSGEESLRMIPLLERLDRDLTIVLIEHDMDVMFNTVDRLLVLDHGTILLEGTPEEVRSSDLVRERYLGTQHAAGAGS